MKTRTAYLSLFAAVLLISVIGVQTADAGIRVSATVRTPTVGIHVDSGPIYHPPIVKRAHLPARRHGQFHVSKTDRQMAKRLGRYTGVSKRELVDLRARGYSWREIGRWLNVNRDVVRASKSARSWKRFLKHEQRYARGNSGRRGHRHVCYDD